MRTTVNDRPQPNGNEHRQDQDIRDLRQAVKDNREVNDTEHRDIAKGAEANFHRIMGRMDKLADAVGSLKGDSKGGRWVANVVRIVVAAAVGGVVWFMARDEARVDKLEIETKGNLEIHNGLRDDIDENKADIEEIQRRHRLPNESDRLRPGKE